MVSMAEFATHTVFLLAACKHNDTENSSFTLYNFSDKLHFEFDKPFLHEKLFVGSQHGWLTVLDLHCEPSLLNPLTGESVSLPSLTTLSGTRHHHSANGDIVSYFCRKNCRPYSNFVDRSFDNCLGEITFKKVLISSNPSTSFSNFFVAALVGCGPKLVVARPGVSRWNFLREEEWYMDIMFRQDGKLICLTGKGAIHEVELKEDNYVITEMATSFSIKNNIDFSMHLAEDCANRVLVICRKIDYIARPKTTVVKVFRLISGKRKGRKWERVKSLEGQATFVGTNASISLTKQDIHGEIKADTIYFTDEWWYLEGDEVESNWPKDICAYNLTSNSINPCCPDEYRQCSWPMPVWIRLPNPK